MAYGDLRMGFTEAIARISQLQGMAAPSPPPAAAAPTQVTAPQSSAGATATASAASFAPALAQAADTPSGASSTGRRIADLARAELARGVAEQPPGSNNSPDIARYRTATQGAVSGAPWCAYFASYIAHEAGAPIGPNGEGMGSVDAVASWARASGKWVPASQQPQPGDLIVFDEHIGIVDHANADGTITTIEGNHSQRVDQVQRRVSEGVLGYVRL